MFNLKSAWAGLCSVIFICNLSYAAEIGLDSVSLNNTPHIQHNTTIELKPISDSYKLARLQYLPELTDSENGWAGNTISSVTPKNDCSAYPLSSCPKGGNCNKCPIGAGYKLNSCTSPYIFSGNTCRCPATVALTNPNDKCTQNCNGNCIAKSCTPNTDKTNCTNGTQTCNNGCGQNTAKCCVACNDTTITIPLNSSYTYTSCTDGNGTKNIKTGWQCNSGYHKTSSNTCEKDCIANNCSGYTLTSCPANGTCSTCTKTAANCSTDGTKYKLDSCTSGYTKSGNTCVKQNSSQIGNILYSDMSTSSSVISGKTPIGIVLDSEKKLAIALNEVQKAWSTEYFDITNLTNQSNAKTDWNGKSNTQTIISYCKTNSKSCPAAEYANAYTTTGTSAGNWYLPAGAELNAIFENRDVLNTALDKVSKTKLDAGNNGYQYWSSSEVAANYAQMQSYTSGYNQYKTVTNYVRPVINYGDVTSTAIGDYLFSDMTTGKDSSEKTPIGVVFDPERKLAVAYEQQNLLWATNQSYGLTHTNCSYESVTGSTGTVSENPFDIEYLPNMKDADHALTDWYGRSNTKTIATYCSNNHLNCPAAFYANNYTTTGTYSGDWHLPSAAELNAIIKNKDVLNKVTGFTKIDGNYWSSSEKDICYAYQQYSGNTKPPAQSKNATSRYVRPVINYGTRCTAANCAECQTGYPARCKTCIDGYKLTSSNSCEAKVITNSSECPSGYPKQQYCNSTYYCCPNWIFCDRYGYRYCQEKNSTPLPQ